MKKISLRFVFGVVTAVLAWSSPAVHAENVVKVADLVTGIDGFGNGYGPSVPQCHFTPVGSNLWFTTQNGGAAGFGGVFSFDPATSNVTQLATLDGNTGNRPWAASLVLANGKAWFTTSRGGTGDKGSLVSIETNEPYALANVYSFPTNANLGQGPHSTPVLIGDDLWITTPAGGLSSAWGAIVKYSLTANTATNVFLLDSTNTGRQPLGSSLVQAGNAYYYLTFAGGTNLSTVTTPTSTNNLTPNGAGVLGKLTFDNLNQPVLSAVPLPGYHVSFAAGDPVFDGTNNLYFTTTGPNAFPGAVVRYDLSKGIFTSLFNFVTNPTVAVTNFGKQPYGTPVLYENQLYFTTLSGGSQGKGVLAKLDLADNSFTKLADFETNNLVLGASPQYNGGTLYTNPATGRIAIYWPINRGGVNGSSPGNGTIVRVDLPPPPIVVTPSNAENGDLVLSWVGGYAPYSIDRKDDLIVPNWTTNWLSGLLTNTVSLSVTGAQGFFRVGSTNQ